MEDVWKEINLSSLHDPASRAARPPFHGAGPVLQDFFTCPTADHSSAEDAHATFFVPLKPPPAFTVLSLSSGPESTVNADSALLRMSSAAAVSVPAPPFVSPPYGPLWYKRSATPDDGEEDGDQRRKRLMKNRESASRSRARKQAYRAELENELEALQKENAKLRRQQLELKLAVPVAVLLPEKCVLRRTLTAPF